MILPNFLRLSLVESLLQLIVTFFLGLVLYAIYKVVVSPIIRMRFYQKQGLPCRYFPVMGHFRHFFTSIKDHGDALYYFKNQSKVNPCRAICSNLGTDVTVSLRDPELVKEFCLNPENYTKDTVFLELLYGLIGKGLITSEGSQWKTQRKIISSAFHFEFLKENLASIQQTAHANLYEQRNISLKEVNIMDAFQKITGEVVGKIFFGEQLNGYNIDGRPLTLALADLLVKVGMLNISPFRFLLGPGFIQKGILPQHRKLMQRVKDFRKICNKLVEERKALRKSETKSENKSKDMLDLLLEYSGEGQMNDEGIIDQFVTFFLAGMDTTGHLLTMAAYYLEKYPECKDQIMKEVQQHYNPEKIVTMEDLDKLEFMMAFLKETLRMSTPVPGVLQRRALKDHNINDIAIRKGDIITLDFPYNNCNAKYFDNEDEFDPVRWLNKGKGVNSYAFIPFSAGPRNCIGQHLALNEARIILCEYLTMYEPSLKKGYQLRMEIKFLYEPIDPVLIDLKVKK